MPIDQNSFNSRITSEALEQKFRDNFPSQGGAELVQDLYASGVIVPIVDFTPTATGDVLPQNLQTALDFSTGRATASNTTTVATTTPGFWLCYVIVTGFSQSGQAVVELNDGITTKTIWDAASSTGSTSTQMSFVDGLVAFVRAGDTLRVRSSSTSWRIAMTYRQIADVNGNVVNPLGFSF